MRNRIENAVVRINIDIDYSSLNDEEIAHLHKLIALGDWQLNAPCNNRLTRIDELRQEMKLLEPGETDKRNEITNKIRDLRISINNDKEQGHFRDYGILKLRIAQGATATEVYSMMPYFYAEAYNLNLQFSSRNKNNNEGKSSSILEGGTKWLNFLKSLSDFFSDSRGQCVDKQAKIVHGYIVSEKYGVAFPLPSQPAKTYKLDKVGHTPVQTGAEYIFTEDAMPPEQDSKFVNTFLVKVYQDAKEGKLR